ncbi:hypothetical protein AMJ49_06045 [Parcubacteria bacterium DG_74_2]|nr:MAG: hypothetical protein AMJ49_06045 [Parcubacteria bacterium DG_74_2]
MYYPKFLSSLPFLLIFFAVLYIIIDWLSYNGSVFIPLVFGIIAIFLLFFKERAFVYFITILLLLSDDVSKYVGIGDSIPESIIGYPFYGKVILAYILVIAFLKIIADFLIRKKNRFSLNIYDKVIIIMFLLYLFSAIVGIPNLLDYSGEYLGHLAPIIVIIISYLLIKRNFYSKDDLIKFFKIIILIFTGRLLATTLMFFSFKDIYYQINYSSVNEFILIPLYFWIGLIIWKNRQESFSIIKKIFVVLMVLMILFNVFIYGQRTIVFFFIISLFLIFLLLLFSIPKFVKAIGLILIIILISGIILIAFMPQHFNYFTLKYKQIFDWSLHPASGTTTIAERQIELINIFGRLVNEKSLLWGEGLGGYFSSEYYPLPPEAHKQGSFPPEQLEKDQFFKPHNSFILIFLQMGILGLFIYLLLILLIILQLFRDFHKSFNVNFKILFFSIFLGGFSIFILNPTLATNFLYGLILALASNGHSIFLKNKIKNLKKL